MNRVRRIMLKHNARRLAGMCGGCEGIRLDTYIAVQSLLLGLHLMFGPAIFSESNVYAGLLLFAREWVWATMLVVSALVKVIGFLFDFNVMRFAGSVALTFTWAMVWWGLLRSGVWTVAFPMVTTLLAAQIFVTTRVTRGTKWTPH